MKTPLPRSGLVEDFADETPLESFLAQHAPPSRTAAAQRIVTVHLLSFALNGELFALDVSNVREVVRPRGIARVPQAPPHVRGVQSLRGHLLPVLDLRSRVGFGPANLGDRSRVVIAEVRARLLGLLVDEVLAVARVPANDIAPPPEEVRHRLSRYVTGVVPVNGRVALVVDVDSLVSLSAPPESE